MLHGKVEVNGHAIVDYKIVNVGPADEGNSIYFCQVEGRDKRGYPYRYDFDLEASGTAPHLVALVMAELDRRLTNA